MESPRRESGQVRVCNQPCGSLLHSASLSRRDELSRIGPASWDIDHLVYLSAVSHLGYLTLETRSSFLYYSTVFSLSFYCFCQAWYSNTMAP